MKESRIFGLVLIALTYVLATAAGIVVFLLLGDGMELWLKVLIADVVATVVVFIVSLITGNSTVYDPYWSVQPMVIVPLIMAVTGTFNAVSIVLLVLVELWGLRLTVNWVYTFKNLTVQDWRYDDLKNSSGKLFIFVNFLGIQMMPTLIVFACQMPIIAFMGSGAEFNPFAFIGILIIALGIFLETVPDLQKHKFRKEGNSGIVNVGLWKNGRHPNYLGEILIWWGVYGIVLAVDVSLWWTFFGALINTLLFLFISIPMAEKQSAKRHGQAWEEHKKNSRLFV